MRPSYIHNGNPILVIWHLYNGTTHRCFVRLDSLMNTYMDKNVRMYEMGYFFYPTPLSARHMNINFDKRLYIYLVDVCVKPPSWHFYCLLNILFIPMQHFLFLIYFFLCFDRITLFSRSAVNSLLMHVTSNDRLGLIVTLLLLRLQMIPHIYHLNHLLYNFPSEPTLFFSQRLLFVNIILC